MDKQTEILTEIADLIKTIQGQATSHGYTYYTETGQVGVYDMALSFSLNNSSELVNHVVDISEDGEQNEEWGIGQNIYTNTLPVVIRSTISASPTAESSRAELRKKCGEVVSDLKALFGTFHTLNNTANWAKYELSTIEWNENGDRLSGATSVFELSVNYSQLLLNPNITTC